jgi:hypothetical protein
MSSNGMTTRPAHGADRTLDEAAGDSTSVTGEAIWRALERCSFAVLSHVTPASEPRSSGVMYALVDRRMYVAIAPDGWKARMIASGDEVAVTVPVRRGGLLALMAPIPPATITFHARATVHPAGSLDIGLVSKELKSILPEARQASTCVLELVPEGRFLTYGIGVSLMDMRDPALALAHVPVS